MLSQGVIFSVIFTTGSLKIILKMLTIGYLDGDRKLAQT